MAAKMFAEVVIAGSYKNLAKSTRGAKKELTLFEKTAKKISAGISAAFAGIAVVGITSIVDGLIDMTKSAANDAKSMALLNKQMENSWKANSKTEKQINDYIDTVSNMTGVLDDDLRPAFAKIVRVTKGPTKAMKAFNMALDISAGTGKDLNTVSAAYSKYLAGNETALNKLVPGLKEATNQAGFLKNQFGGMAETAGRNDPFARINAVMDNFKEKLGQAFLPVVEMFADWLASDKAQAMLDNFAQMVAGAFSWLTSEDGKNFLKGMAEMFMTTVNQIIDAIKALTKFIGQVYDFFKGIVKAIGDFIATTPFGQFMAADAAVGPKIGEQVTFGRDVNPYAVKPGNIGLSVTPSVTGTNTPGSTINIYGTVSGNDVVNALKKIANTRGVPLAQLLR